MSCVGRLAVIVGKEQQGSLRRWTSPW